jgi:hypothetical protein
LFKKMCLLNQSESACMSYRLVCLSELCQHLQYFMGLFIIFTDQKKQ